MMTVVEDSQKIMDINPWDFEPDFSPAASTFVAVTMFYHSV